MRLAAAAFVVTLASVARADECRVPLEVVGCAEWTFFDSVGAARFDGGWRPTFGVGAELAWVVARYHGFPSGSYYGAHGDAEVSIGPWAAASTRGRDGVVEAGLAIHDGGGWHASWGSFDLRVGAGYGLFDRVRSGHAVVTLGYGVRSALFRYTENHQPPTVPGKVDVARLFGTMRAPFDGRGAELVLGVELSPSFFFPPLTWWRVGGGPPQ